MGAEKFVKAIERRVEEVRRSLPPDMEVDGLVLSTELHCALLAEATAGAKDIAGDRPRTLLGLKYSVDASDDCAPLGVVCRVRRGADRMEFEHVPLQGDKWRLSEGVHVCDCDFTEAQVRAIEDFFSRRRMSAYRAMPLERRI